MAYTLILYLGLAIALIVILNSLKRSGTAAVGLDPRFWFSVMFIAVHIGLPLFKYNVDIFRYQDSYEEGTRVWIAALMVLIYTITMTLTSSLSKRNLTRARKGLIQVTTVDRTNLLLLIAMGCFIVGLFGVYRNFGLMGDDFMTDRISAGAGRGLSRLLPNLLISGALLSLYVFAARKRTKRLHRRIAFVTLIACVGLAGIYFNSINSRNSIFLMMILCSSLFYVLRPTRVSINVRTMQLTLLVCVGLPLLFNAYEQMTRQRYEAIDSTYTSSRLENITYYMLDGAFGNDENLLWLNENGFEPQQGVTYIAGLTVFVPRSIWPDKPLGAGPRLKNFIYPGSYTYGASGNSSLTTGLFTEGYMNFGIAGLFVAAIGWIASAYILLSRVVRRLGSLRMVPWLTGLVLWCSALMYQEFLGFFARSVFLLAPLFFASIACTVQRKRKISRTRPNGPYAYNPPLQPAASGSVLLPQDPPRT